jgi:hypothetical protein
MLLHVLTAGIKLIYADNNPHCVAIGLSLYKSDRGALHSKKAYGIFGFLKIRGFFSGFSGFSPDFLADF